MERQAGAEVLGGGVGKDSMKGRKGHKSGDDVI